jgi:hypothetical protein
MAIILYKQLQGEKSGINPIFVRLMETINALPGITVKGTDILVNRNSIMFFIERDDILEDAGIFFLLRCIDKRYFFNDKWSVRMDITDMRPEVLKIVGNLEITQRPIYYILESKFEDLEKEMDNLLRDACFLIENLNHHYNHSAFMTGYMMDKDKFFVVDELALIREEKLKKLIF